MLCFRIDTNPITSFLHAVPHSSSSFSNPQTYLFHSFHFLSFSFSNSLIPYSSFNTSNIPLILHSLHFPKVNPQTNLFHNIHFFPSLDKTALFLHCFHIISAYSAYQTTHMYRQAHNKQLFTHTNPIHTLNKISPLVLLSYYLFAYQCIRHHISIERLMTNSTHSHSQTLILYIFLHVTYTCINDYEWVRAHRRGRSLTIFRLEAVVVKREVCGSLVYRKKRDL